jgi:hypothetical protein
LYGWCYTVNCIDWIIDYMIDCMKVQ